MLRCPYNWFAFLVCSRRGGSYGSPRWLLQENNIESISTRLEHTVTPIVRFSDVKSYNPYLPMLWCTNHGLSYRGLCEFSSSTSAGKTHLFVQSINGIAIHPLLPEGTCAGVGLVLLAAIQAPIGMGAVLARRGRRDWWICVWLASTAGGSLTMLFARVRTSALETALLLSAALSRSVAP